MEDFMQDLYHEYNAGFTICVCNTSKLFRYMRHNTTQQDEMYPKIFLVKFLLI